MAFNLDAIKQKFQDASEGKNIKSGGNNQTFFFKCQENETRIIRLIEHPEVKLENDFAEERHFHYVTIPGQKERVAFICPKRTYGGECPICNLSYALWDQVKERWPSRDERFNNPEANRVSRLVKSLFSVHRFYSYVLPRKLNENEQGPLIWGYSSNVHDKLMKYFVDEDWGNIADVHEGFDIKAELVKGKQFNEYSIKIRPKSVPLASSDEEIQEIFDKTSLISSGEMAKYFVKMPHEEMVNLADKFYKGYVLATGGTVEDVSNESMRGGDDDASTKFAAFDDPDIPF